MPLPPGTILQQMHLKGRLKKKFSGGFFYDVGAGSGNLSGLLLNLGFSGEGFDLNAKACALNERENKRYVAAHRYRARCEDFMMAEISRVADVIVCSMVLEHWPEDQVEAFFARAGGLLAKNGIICILVPGSPRHWGIEDEIAGHRRRYTLESFRFLAPKMGLIINDLRGLTYPLSNWLLPLSNWLVRRGEGHKLNLSMQEQTMSSGVREVPFKTEFPRFTGWLVNEVTLLPFHLWQHWAARSQDCLVIYCELRRP